MDAQEAAMQMARIANLKMHARVLIIEPTFSDFYQFSVSVILDKPVTKLKLDRIDVENDPITKIIYDYFKYFMDTLNLNK